MKLTIRIRHLRLTAETYEEIGRRIHLAFARIRPWLHTVDVTLDDINGPKGGADKQCRLRVRGRGMPAVVIEHVGVDAVATVASAVERGEQVFLRMIARRRSFARLPDSPRLHAFDHRRSSHG